MSEANCHIESMLKELQSDPTLGDSGARDDLFRPSSDSAGVGGSSDPLEKERLPSSRVSVVSNSESDDASTLSGTDGTRYYREETARLVEQLGDSRVQVAILEAREAENSLYIQRLEEEVIRLVETVEQGAGNLTRRQDQVEQEVQPLLGEQSSSIIDLLQDFDVSEALYMELKSIPEQQRSAREHILILAYEKFQHDQEEIQELRKSQDFLREALTRANDEVQKLTNELHRVAVNHANDRRKSESDMSVNVAQIERLEAERRNSLAQIEVLSAKVASFDEVQVKLENLGRSSIDVENQKAALEVTLQMATQEKESLRNSIKEKDLTSVDKTYLSKEVEFCKEQMRKLESELEQQHKKLRDVKRERTELHNKVISDKRDSQAEILQIKEQRNATSSELDQMKAVFEATKNALDQSRSENEAFIAKEKTLIEKFNEQKTELENSLLGLKEELRITRDELEVFQKEKERLESLEREKAKSFSAWRTSKMEGKLEELSVSENQLPEQNLGEVEERVSRESQSLQGDIRKLLRARSSVEQLHSLLKEKGVSISVSRLSSATTSSRSSLKAKRTVYSSRISNLGRTASPTRKELQMMIDRGEMPPRCHQHRSCSSHYPKAYEELVDTMCKPAPGPFSQVPDSAPVSSAPAPAPFSPVPASPQTQFSQGRNSCS